ncbi:unnamed protein product [Dibothriocephalus latus]|uniref:Osteopetrosis-associated transmembrane protein 1 n=1 Tax=Dibothriocephalus latus TaxID=60516 RepID=A0A3P7P6X1_DIBLA|nr:unnamed protein product [Dibothriocephalus latus]
MRDCVALYTSILIISLFVHVDDGTKFTTTECDKYFNTVSEIVGLAFDCFGVYSQPVAFCGQCVEIMEQLYDTLNDSQVKNDYGLPCLSFINSSSAQSPIRDILGKVVDTWQRGHCSSCLAERRQRFSPSKIRQMRKVKTDLRSSAVASSSYPDYKYTAYDTQAVSFFAHLNDTLLCLRPFLHNTSASFLDPVNFPPPGKVSFDATVCTICRDTYRNLIKVYNYHTSAEKEHKGVWVCRDVSDALNRTHWVWHHLLHCAPHRTAVRPIVALVPLLTCSFLLVLFHCCLLCCCHRPIRLIIYKPRRVEAVSPNASAPLSRKDINSNHNLQACDSTDNNDEMVQSLSVQFRKRRFGSHCGSFSYDILHLSHADENN